MKIIGFLKWGVQQHTVLSTMWTSGSYYDEDDINNNMRESQLLPIRMEAKGLATKKKFQITIIRYNLY